MNEKRTEKQLRKMGNRIPVNNELKQALKQSFHPQKKRRLWFTPWMPLAASALVLCLAFVIVLQPVQTVSADSLKIENQYSFIGIGSGSGIGIAEFGGTVYVPVAGKGIFAYDNNGFHSVLTKDVSSVSISTDGTQLAFSADGGISIINLQTKEVQDILKTGDSNTVYDHPTWAPDGKALLYTKLVTEPNPTHGFTVKESGIYSVSLDTLESSKLTDGANASFVANAKAIVFERDVKIIYKSLKDGAEREIDSGRFPSVSPDGTHVSYVKTEESSRVLSGNASVHESIDNVWIADIGEKGSKKQATSNGVYAFTDENDWLHSLSPSNIPQVLSFSGLYSYYDTAWSSDGNTLYVLKNSNSEQSMKIMRIDLATQPQTAADTVRRYLQALTLRDEDYAKSLMKNPPALLTVSNPHPVGYRITGSGEEDGKDYVDAEQYWAYTASPYYQIITTRYYLSEGGSGYIIDETADKDSLQVYTKNTGVWLNENGSERQLFAVSDLPTDYSAEDPRFLSLCYNKNSGAVVFALASNDAVTLLRYDSSSKTFSKIDTIKPTETLKNIGITKITMNASGGFAAVDLFAQKGENWISFVIVYNLQNSEVLNLGSLLSATAADSISSLYWDESSLVFAGSGSGQTMNYTYAIQ